jgi:Na+-driven multidrug efflux pump
MMNVMLFEGMVSIYEVPGGILRAMGHSYMSSIIAIFGTVVFRVIWINTVFKVWNSFEILMVVYPVSWILISLIMLPAYFIVIKREQKRYMIE